MTDAFPWSTVHFHRSCLGFWFTSQSSRDPPRPSACPQRHVWLIVASICSLTFLSNFLSGFISGQQVKGQSSQPNSYVYGAAVTSISLDGNASSQPLLPVDSAKWKYSLQRSLLRGLFLTCIPLSPSLLTVCVIGLGSRSL